MKGLERLRKLSCWWRYGRRLSVYLDDELSRDAARATTSHLSNCAYCRVELETLRLANRALHEFEMPVMLTPIVAGNVYRLPQPKEVSFFKKLCSQRITVPLPFAAGLSVAVVGIAVSGFVWIGTTDGPAMTVPAATPVVVEFVKVPVDRVVTRTVYVKQPASGQVQVSSGKNGISAESNKSLAHNSGSREWADNALKDFRPAANANFRVIKEHEE